MEIDEVPEELMSPPEKRLVQTLITTRPNPKSFSLSFAMALLIALVSQLYWIDWQGLAEYLPAVQNKIFVDKQYWRAFTAVLIHADLGHLASNLYMLGILSYFVYGYFGAQVYPLLTFFGAGLVNFVSVATYPPHVQLLGASGWVYLLGGFWLSMYLMIQRQFSFSRRLARVVGIALMIFFPTTFEPTTSYRTHFIGFVFGVLLALVYFYGKRQEIRAFEDYRYVG